MAMPGAVSIFDAIIGSGVTSDDVQRKTALPVGLQPNATTHTYQEPQASLMRAIGDCRRRCERKFTEVSLLTGGTLLLQYKKGRPGLL